MAVDDSYTVSLLHFDGNLNDESGKTWTAYGGAEASSTQSKFGGNALCLNSTSAYIQADQFYSEFNVGTSNLTVDWWEYRTSNYTGTGSIFSLQPNTGISNAGLYIGRDFALFLSSVSTEWEVYGVSLGTQLLNQWVHRAIVRNGSSWLIFQNGAQVNSVTWSKSIYAPTNPCVIGVGHPTLYIDEFRFSKGIARWTSNFMPPTVQYGTTTVRRRQQTIGGF